MLWVTQVARSVAVFVPSVAANASIEESIANTPDGAKTAIPHLNATAPFLFVFRGKSRLFKKKLAKGDEFFLIDTVVREVEPYELRQGVLPELLAQKIEVRFGAFAGVIISMLKKSGEIISELDILVAHTDYPVDHGADETRSVSPRVTVKIDGV